MPSPHSDRNLLFGILAVQLDFINRDQLVAAMHDWLLAKPKSLSGILVDKNVLGAERAALVDALVIEHLKQHNDDPHQSLAALSSLGSSLAAELQRLGDPEIQASLAVVGASWSEKSTMQVTRSTGDSTSSGSRFTILRPHAKGGLGEVFVAMDQELNREVALKEIQSRYLHDEDNRARFVLEAEITGGLEHPGIVPVYGLGHFGDGRPYYAMRFVKGDSLKEAIRRFHENDRPDTDPSERMIEFRKLLGRFVDVCNAVEYAHSRGVLHRDLKPGNIMLGKYGETLVVDWGLAKAVGRSDAASDTDEPTLRPASGSGSAPTQLGSALGTPHFMSPEQAAGRIDQLGPASDVYSLGATLYCLITGQTPFAESDIGVVLERVKAGDFPRPTALKPEAPRALESICLKAMSLNLSDRYQSPQLLADDVERYLADEPVMAHSEPVLVKGRRWIRKHPKSVAAIAATVLVSLASLIAIAAVVTNKNRLLYLANAELKKAND